MSDALDLAADRAIAGQLARCWGPFFGRHGRLTAVQRAAIPVILQGTDALVCSPTASGKTEAVCAPLLERHARIDNPGTVLYVSPTRALVNDLYGRLQSPVEQLGLRVVRRTGEYKSLPSGVVHVLLTTPESLDSMLCRGRDAVSGHVLAGVSALVMDEIHLLDGTPRGGQLRWLAERLRRLREYAREEGWIADSGLQRVALSATVREPEVVASRYLCAPVVVSVPGTREIVSVGSDGLEGVEVSLPEVLRAEGGFEKVLVFCNTRRRVDTLATEMRPVLSEIGFEVRAHHGSLDKTLREDAERAARRAPRIVLFTTSTLEIGIDIGDIDLVVLDGPAPDVPSLLQRIGRGNRRKGTTVVLPCSTSPVERALHAAMLECARKGDLGPVEEGRQCAVARQQVASFVFQSPKCGRSRGVIDDFVATCEPGIESSGLLEHLVQSNELLLVGDEIRLGDEWLEAARTGAIHSNIEAAAGDTMVDVISGAVLATGIRRHSGRLLAVGGGVVSVQNHVPFTIRVRPDNSGAKATGELRYVTGPRFIGAAQPYALRRALGLDDEEWPVIREGGWTVAYHLWGGRMAAVLRLVEDLLGHGEAKVGPWFVAVPDGEEGRPSRYDCIDATGVEAAVAANLDAIEQLLVRPRANRRLPLTVRVAEARSWLDVPRQIEAIRASRWLPADQRLPPGDVELLRGLREERARQ